jgi:hypothetical protein
MPLGTYYSAARVAISVKNPLVKKIWPLIKTSGASPLSDPDSCQQQGKKHYCSLAITKLLLNSVYISQNKRIES